VLHHGDIFSPLADDSWLYHASSLVHSPDAHSLCGLSVWTSLPAYLHFLGNICIMLMFMAHYMLYSYMLYTLCFKKKHVT